MAGFDHFSHLAPFYDRAMPFKGLDRLLELGGFAGNELVLDAGGGTGRVASALRPFVRCVVIADLSEGMLVNAAQKKIPVLLSPVEKLPFQKEKFDRVVMIDALHHVIDQEQTAEELWRVTAPGGTIMIMEPDIRRFAVKTVALAEKIALMRSHFLSPAKISSLFDKHTREVSIINDGFGSWILARKTAKPS